MFLVPKHTRGRRNWLLSASTSRSDRCSRTYHRLTIALRRGENVMRSLSAKVTRAVAVAGMLLCTGLFSAEPSAALETPKVVRGVLILEGKIESGDYITVRNFLSEPSNFKKMTGEIFLASQGGNVTEALKIGYLIRHLRLSTDAPSRPPPTVRSSGGEIIRPLDLTNPRNYTCASACFLLYVAGVYREFIWAGRLGIHHPQIDYKPIGTTESDLSIATVDMRDKIKRYFEEMNVPSKYLDIMYSTPPNDVHWITQREFDSDLKGYIPQVQALLDAKCKGSELRKCIVQTKNEIRMEAWRTIFHRD